jgi:hypothetical protein
MKHFCETREYIELTVRKPPTQERSEIPWNKGFQFLNELTHLNSANDEMGRRAKGMHPIRQIRIKTSMLSAIFDLDHELLVDREGSIARARNLHDLALADARNPSHHMTMNQAILRLDATRIEANATAPVSASLPGDAHDQDVAPEEEIQPFDESLVDSWDREWQGMPGFPYQSDFPY